MSTACHETHEANPPKLLKTPLEVLAVLRQLHASNAPLSIQFQGRTQRYHSYLVEIDQAQGRLALDEVLPQEGDRLFKQGESFNLESHHEGVRITWVCERGIQPGAHNGNPCYWSSIPSSVVYHQRRNAFRAPLPSNTSIKLELSTNDKRKPLPAVVVDISATGCQLRIEGDLRERLLSGQVFTNTILQMPYGSMSTSLEVRHVYYRESEDTSIVGARLFNMSGLAERNLERYVYQLQREARRAEPAL